MGCFSYLCNECNEQIWNDKYGDCEGEEVILTRLKKGKIMEIMIGRYTSYGTVHIGKSSSHYIYNNGKKEKILNEEGTHEWKSEDWSKMVDEHFDSDYSTGISAVHIKCKAISEFKNYRSDNCPNQGWKDNDDFCEDSAR